MAFDPLVANPNRLRILTALAVNERQEFVQLRGATELTDGNLASHARRLQSGGLIAIDKQFRSGKPVTQITLTPQGRAALESHVRRLFAAISHRKRDVVVVEQPQSAVAFAERTEEMSSIARLTTRLSSSKSAGGGCATSPTAGGGCATIASTQANSIAALPPHEEEWVD